MPFVGGEGYGWGWVWLGRPRYVIHPVRGATSGQTKRVTSTDHFGGPSGTHAITKERCEKQRFPCTLFLSLLLVFFVDQAQQSSDWNPSAKGVPIVFSVTDDVCLFCVGSAINSWCLECSLLLTCRIGKNTSSMFRPSCMFIASGDC